MVLVSLHTQPGADEVATTRNDVAGMLLLDNGGRTDFLVIHMVRA
jgi:hypothetical protein